MLGNTYSTYSHIQISQKAVDVPVTGNFKPEELHSYPPRMVCRFFFEKGAVSTTSTLALKGFDRPVSVDMALHIAKPQVTVDSTELQVWYTGVHTGLLVYVLSLSYQVDWCIM